MTAGGRPVFPFSALRAQERLQQALLLIAIDPRIGGLLIEGPRGTAKSTSARALAELLPGGSFVNLPLGATEEMLIGTLDIEAALQGGEVRFAPGLLAHAHGGVLYVDEVNLLPDVLVDQLLDVVASGVNVIERDGISHQHPASFALIGTMNPEEGELRPQFLDRFGLALLVENCSDPAVRAEIVKARLAFDADPAMLRERFAPRQAELGAGVVRARAELERLTISDAVHAHVSALCIAARVEGLRADLVMTRTARALAAWQGDAAVGTVHVDAVAELVLHHRRRSPSSAAAPPPGGAEHEPAPREDRQSWGELPPPPLEALPAKAVSLMAQKKKTMSREAGMLDSRTGRRWSAPAAAAARGSGESRRVHWLRTLMAKGCGPLRREHLSYWPMSARAGALHCFLVDCSGSMLRGRQLALAKGVLRELIHSAYQQRAEVAIVGFAGKGAKVHLSPTLARPHTSNRVESWLQPIRGGGATPFGHGASAAGRLLAGAARARPAQLRWLWLLTDGRSVESPGRPPAADVAVVIDCEQRRGPLGRCRTLAERWRAHYRVLEDFTQESPAGERP